MSVWGSPDCEAEGAPESLLHLSSRGCGCILILSVEFQDGVGPKAVGILKAELAARGLSLAAGKK
ncbi:hypothetical protein GCM10012319_72560 [Comamonas sp. KCTC 72670]|nr:hypothetical protein GCM10012319_72560 [Comamonas sp. KCTC 72670]